VTVLLLICAAVRRAFTSRLLILLSVVAFLFLAVTGCLYGAQLYGGGRVYAGAEQLALARAVSYHLTVGWGILFAIMLAMGAAARPLEDGRTALLLAKPVRRRDVLLGQLGGAFLTAVATVVAFGLLSSALFVLRGHAFPATFWLALATSCLALALATTLVAFFSVFLPRLVAAVLGIILYAASFPAASARLRDFMTGGYRDAGLSFPWYLRWASEVYFAATPPLAGVQLRAAELLKLEGWGLDGWLTLATAAVYIFALFVATWALFSRRDV